MHDIFVSQALLFVEASAVTAFANNGRKRDLRATLNRLSWLCTA
jgi:hypothetical protein